MTFFEATVYDRTWFVVLKLLASAVGSAGAVVVCFLGTQHYFVQLGSHDWPEATMTVIRSSRSGNTGVAVDYSFMVEGKTYSGSRVLDGGVAPATSRQEEVLKEYARSTAHPDLLQPRESRGLFGPQARRFRSSSAFRQSFDWSNCCSTGD